MDYVLVTQFLKKGEVQILCKLQSGLWYRVARCNHNEPWKECHDIIEPIGNREVLWHTLNGALHDGISTAILPEDLIPLIAKRVSDEEAAALLFQLASA